MAGALNEARDMAKLIHPAIVPYHCTWIEKPMGSNPIIYIQMHVGQSAFSIYIISTFSSVNVP